MHLKGGDGMYNLLRSLLEDKKGGEVFTCFGLFHICVILFFAAVLAVLLVFLRRRPDRRANTARWLIGLAFGLYVADFFLMPLAYGYIDIEKLPFHACTAMCVLCFLSDHNAFLGRFRLSFALLALVSNLVYLVYPAGVMWHQVHPASYRVLQTLGFHGVMTLYGFVVLCFENPLQKHACRDLAVLVFMTLWSLMGNMLYNGQAEGYDHFFNWFFVIRDPFYLLPEKIAPFFMPLINIAVFFGAEQLLCLPVKLARKDFAHNKNKDNRRGENI